MPDSPYNDERSPPRGQPPATPAARDTTQGTHTKGPIPRPHTPTTRAQKKWATGPSYPPKVRTAGRGRLPDTRHSSQKREAAPPRTYSRHPHSAQRQLTRAHAVEPLLRLRPHARTNRLPARGTGSRRRESA